MSTSLQKYNLSPFLTSCHYFPLTINNKQPIGSPPHKTEIFLKGMWASRPPKLLLCIQNIFHLQLSIKEVI